MSAVSVFFILVALAVTFYKTQNKENVRESLAASITVNPGESIQTKCINSASSGDICTVNSGTYPGRLTVNKSLTITCSGSCKITDGFTVTSNNTTIRGFEITGTYGIYIKGAYITVENNRIHDISATNGGIQLADSTVNHVIVRNNKIDHIFNQCVEMAGNFNTLENNDCGYVKEPIDNPSGDADCFDVFGGNNTFRNNTCHDIWYKNPGFNYANGDYVDNAHVDCFQTYLWDSKGGALHDSLFEGNYCNLPDFEVNVATAKGFQMAGWHNIPTPTPPFECNNLKFQNNVLYTHLLGILNHCQNITLTNNTFVGTLDSASGGLHLLNMAGVTTIRYNIFADVQQTAYTLYDKTFNPTVVDGYNFIWRSNGNPYGTPKTGDVWGVNPQFVDTANGNYHLKPGSPACGFGAYACGVTATITLTITPTKSPSSTPTPISTNTPPLTLTPVIIPGLNWWTVNLNLVYGEQRTYSFSVPSTGKYIIKSIVNAPTTGDNSYLVKIDSVPSEPYDVWDIINLTNGFEVRTVSIRGTGSDVDNEFNPKVFDLTAGTHTLYLIGRENGTQIQQLKLEQYINSTIQGDLNKDGRVDIFDYNILVTNYGSTVCGNIADINLNCRVDVFDYNLLISNYGK